MIDLLLIHPNDQKAVYGDTLKYVACEPPYWMALAAEYCRDRGMNVKLIDAEAENMSFEEVAALTGQLSPYLVGIFVTGTNLSASTQKMQGADVTCQTIKEKCSSDVPVFLWGLHPSALPERTLQEDTADYIIKGENFDTIINLVKYHKGEMNLSADEMGGLFYRDKSSGKIEDFGFGKILDTNNLPMPAWDMLDMKKYTPHNWHVMGEENPNTAKGRYGVISASIGCPFHCSYCAISSQFGVRKLRFWEAERVVDEIERLVKTYNTKYIKFLDECFVLKQDYVSHFCDLLIERHLDINAWCYARIDTITPELMTKLHDAGLFWMCYGIESGDDAVLNDVFKGQYTTNRTVEVINQTKEHGLYVNANFMFGLPGDTKETMEKSLQFARKLNPEWINFYSTMLLPGSKDYFDAVERGDIKNDKWIEYAQYSYECKPAGGRYLSPKEVLEFRDYAFHAFFENNNRYFNNIREKFGQQYVDSIKSMNKNRLRRQLLGD